LSSGNSPSHILLESQFWLQRRKIGKKKEKKGNASRRLIALKIPPVNRGEQEYI